MYTISGGSRPLAGLGQVADRLVGSAAGLQWADVRLAERRIAVTDRLRRLKNVASNRDVPIPEPLAQLLAAHRTRYPGGPADPVFPAPFDDYRRARRLFQAAALEAQLHDGGRNPSGVPRPNVTMHDLRHTFGVHCAQAGYRSCGYRSDSAMPPRI